MLQFLQRLLERFRRDTAGYLPPTTDAPSDLARINTALLSALLLGLGISGAVVGFLFDLPRRRPGPGRAKRRDRRYHTALQQLLRDWLDTDKARDMRGEISFHSPAALTVPSSPVNVHRPKGLF